MMVCIKLAKLDGHTNNTVGTDMKQQKRTHTLRVLIHAVSVAVLLTQSSNASDKTYWNVRKIDFHCLMENLSAYKALEDDQIIIFFSACPETDIDIALSLLSKNQIISDVEKIEDNATTPAEVITLTPKQIACLEGQQFVETGNIIELPRNPCRHK